MANKTECNDKKCPIHGDVTLRGRRFVGTIVTKDMHGTAVVEWERRKEISKYERFEKRKTKISVHNPQCINANKGDRVLVEETRPLSKTKHFVVIEKMS